ncbi:23S rRNA (uracil(1939)-C(5))-methyltransferase RlmD [Limosilactobacillus fermentum]|uniref:23S rRNA (uracil(1939)-C(5))-methyltransferase RlmD n=1 Tax=Limosilactobacillus fermentum TaxID=1613 RepID=UPI0021A8FA07|nr:23S rRNA (uracil(1939)-C(5))-methyltransferase RlmD [Limosilactobacillus fermentum]MCT2870794.1 23S rRNA (uracil(1939)-C(5))-methyltransferase RlmD [Limosilactobacillus fermentum]
MQKPTHRNFKRRPKRYAHPVDAKVGDRFPLSIKKLGVEGQGIGYFKHKVCFVPGALPGEVVVAEVTVVHDNYLEAKLHQLRQPSPDRVTPKDAYAGLAGGFELETLAYDKQLAFKKQVVLEALAKFKPLGYRHYWVKDTLAAPHPYGYRNKAQFQVRMQDGHVVAGLYQANSHTVVDMQTCAVQMPGTMKVINTLVKLIEELAIPVYNEANQSGIIKTLAVRESLATGQIQVAIITNTAKLIKKHALLVAIEDQLPEVTSVVQNVNPGDTPLVWGDETTLLYGQDYITESLMGLDFRLSVRSFLQLNPEQTEVLYEEAAKALDLSKDDTLIDAYAGIGTIGLSLANRVKQVIGMETIADAVQDANNNATLNGVTNARYEVGPAEELLPKWRSQGQHFDALVVDPPRTGLDNALIDTILQEKPAKFAYVSCNMATLARNLARLVPTYRVAYIQPVDMLPQTPRCEAVVKLVLNED